MDYDKEVIRGVTIIRIKGKRLTSTEAPEMKTKLLSLVLEDNKQILVNIKEVEYIDSTGLGAFLFGVRQAQQHRKDLRFCELQPKVKFIVRIAHLDEVIQYYETEKQALDDFK
jgi:anti-sigma B factor antagonist